MYTVIQIYLALLSTIRWCYILALSRRMLPCQFRIICFSIQRHAGQVNWKLTAYPVGVNVFACQHVLALWQIGTQSRFNLPLTQCALGVDPAPTPSPYPWTGFVVLVMNTWFYLFFRKQKLWVHSILAPHLHKRLPTTPSTALQLLLNCLLHQVTPPVLNMVPAGAV